VEYSTLRRINQQVTRSQGLKALCYSYIYNRLQLFKWIYMPSNCRVYYPPEDPASGLVHFQVYELS